MQDKLSVEWKEGPIIINEQPNTMISARAGHKLSLDMVQHAYSCAPSIEDQAAIGFMFKFVTKEEFENTVREYQRSQNEMKSDVRDKALAFYREFQGWSE